MSASEHLDRAREYLGRGEDYYRKAAEEIQAAMAEDPTLGYREVGRRLGRGRQWVADLVRWATSVQGAGQPTPYSGSDYADGKADDHARRVLRQRPEVVAEALADAPPAVVDRIARAALNAQLARTEPLGPVAAEYLLSPAPDPSDYEIDRLAERIAQLAHDLRARVESYGVRSFAPLDVTAELIERAIRDLGEARAAVTELRHEEALQ